MANPFEAIRAKAGDQQKSVDWYQAQVRKLGAINTNQLMREGKFTNQILPGFMYMFYYDPKYKETLPYYDRFPLVLPFRRVPGGFYAINFHYLPYLVRIRMLEFLNQYATDEGMSENTRLRLSWRLIESSSRLKPIQHCVKHYLNDHVRSRFLNIPYTDWVTATQLPVERFIGAKKDTVWRETRKKYL